LVQGTEVSGVLFCASKDIFKDSTSKLEYQYRRRRTTLVVSIPIINTPMGACASKSLQELRDEEITAELEAARQREEQKIKILLLGTEGSGKSTIMKQMRILYMNGSFKTDKDLKMYGVIVRSNIVTAVRKVCQLTRDIGLESKLDEESAATTAADLSDASGTRMTPREAFDQIVAYMVDKTATEPFPRPIPKEHDERDWVGKSPLAGVEENENAELFLQHVEAIRVLWQVSFGLVCFSLVFLTISYGMFGFHFLSSDST
jgi:hypothetical protein